MSRMHAGNLSRIPSSRTAGRNGAVSLRVVVAVGVFLILQTGIPVAVQPVAQARVERLVSVCAGEDAQASAAACRDLLRTDEMSWSESLESEVLLSRLAEAAETARDWSASAQLWRDATNRFPLNAQYHYRLGRVLADELGRLEEAYGPLLQAVSLSPALSDALIRLGYVQRRLKRADEAITTYRKLVELNPESAKVWAGLGEAQRQSRRYVEALSSLQRTLEIHANRTADVVGERVAIADAQFWLGRAPEAIEILGAPRDRQTSLERPPEVRCAMATVLTAVGDGTEVDNACRTLAEPDRCACQLWHPSSSRGRVEDFNDTDAAVTLAALRADEAENSAAGSFVVREYAALSLGSAPSFVSTAIAARLRRAAVGQPSGVLDALERFVARGASEKRVRFNNASMTPSVVSDETLRRTFSGKGPRFYDQFRNARGFITLSIPTYNRDGTAAVLLLQRTEMIDHPSVRLFMLERGGGSFWRAVGYIGVD